MSKFYKLLNYMKKEVIKTKNTWQVIIINVLLIVIITRFYMPLTNTFIEKPKRVKKKRVQKVKIKSNNVLYSKIESLGFGTLLLNKLDNKKEDYGIIINNIHKSHKIEMHIDSEEQHTYLKQSVGCARKAYNLALA